VKAFKLVESNPRVSKVRVDLDGAVEPIASLADLALRPEQSRNKIKAHKKKKQCAHKIYTLTTINVMLKYNHFKFPHTLCQKPAQTNQDFLFAIYPLHPTLPESSAITYLDAASKT
jgi:hypothetical protein